MPSADFEAFRHRVLQEPALQEELRAHPDPAAFPLLVAELAASVGLTVEPDEVVTQLHLARETRAEPWI
jgi:Nif11 domain